MTLKPLTRDRFCTIINWKIRLEAISFALEAHNYTPDMDGTRINWKIQLAAIRLFLKASKCFSVFW